MSERLTVEGIDHIVLTVADVDATCAWYERVLGMRCLMFDGDRTAITFGEQKINLHASGGELEPHAASPLPGSADLCFVTTIEIGPVVAFLENERVEVEVGPVARSGATGPMMSVYVRDPDANLVEIACYDGTRADR